MDTSILVGPALFEMGNRLLAKLDQAGLPVIAAFWTYSVSGGEGSFVIASPLVDAAGTLAVYERILSVIHRSPEIHIPFGAVVVVGEHDPVVRTLGQIDFPRENFDMTLYFPNYSTYAPYLPEDQSSLRVHVYRAGSAAAATKLAEAVR